MSWTRLLFLSAGVAVLFDGATVGRLTYPVPPQSDQTDDYHGVGISDPYRVLENADAAATQKFVEQENALTASLLAKDPGRDAIKTELTALVNYERFNRFQKAGGRYFYFRNSGLQNQSVLYVTDSLNGPGRVLLDPNTYRADGTAAYSDDSVSWNGKLDAYAIAQAGSDWQEWRVRDVATGKDTTDVIRWTKGAAVAWAADDRGFYYSRFPEPAPAKLLTAMALNAKIYFHKLGEAQSADKLIFERPDHPDWLLNPIVLEGSRLLFYYTFAGVFGKNMISWQDPATPNAPVIDLVPTAEHSYDPVGIVDSALYLMTNDGAPKGRVIAVELAHPERARWKEIVPEREETLEAVQMAGGKLLLSYMKDAHSAAKLVTLEGKPVADVELPGIGDARWSTARVHDDEMFFGFASFTIPPSIYRLDVTTGKTMPIRQSKISFDSSAFETKQIFYRSKDGTRIPMFLSYRKGLKLDGNNPALLSGYGGFDIPETPRFDPAIAEWMRIGGVYALANLRGGSEYGEAWHQAGMRDKKQNVFDDFIAAAEWLIANKYTSTPKLAILGGSNGGLLIGAVLNQRPDLFGAAMPAVGVMDMLRFQKFGFGVQWVGEYGTSENEADFKVLRAYSPLHNIRKGAKYPPVLITTSDHDDRVTPGHSLKYAATLQQAQEGPAPILIRVETRAGHGAGKPISKWIDEWADRLTFLKMSLAM